ncbi:MAG: exonuclease SbcCD subunit D [Lachnospiraceae bacterium]|nr:exonuclease SbcCD subunit D [Lachnospiraceae bacterium]
MKFFHISDLHIGKQLHHYNLKEDQRYIFNQILEHIEREQPKAILIAGDIYDSAVPSAEAVALFDEFLTELSQIKPEITVLIIAGNHDSGKRLSYASRILNNSRVYIAGLPPMTEEEHIQKVVLEDIHGEINFYLLPFTKPAFVRSFQEEGSLTYQEAIELLLGREEIDTTKRNVILSHQFYVAGGKEPVQSESEMHTVGGLDQIDISVLADFDYAALGHIHRPQKMGRETVRYCGTPLQYSISEASDKKSITMVTFEEKGSTPTIEEIPLKPLHPVRKLEGTLHEILENAKASQREDFVSITLTDDIDPYYPKERLEELYHRILELRIDNARTRKILDFSDAEPEIMHPKEAFLAFFTEMHGREMTKEESLLMDEIILKCQEGAE